MICPTCGTETPPPLERCPRCSTPLPRSAVEAGPGRAAADSAVTELRKIEGPLQIGEVFGRYRILRMLGSGGMGHVYEAWDQELGEAVALKVIRRELASDPDVDSRFKRELSVARQVTHKNVVRIHDLGQVEGVKYISMSFIDGVDLATMMSREKLPLELALSIARQLCAGLAAAHQAGVIHRDLKPANVMIDRAGQVYLMDFGLARSLEAQQYTATGVLVGTVEYMAPEQAQGQPVDHRSDVYALGLILFEMATGDRPFKGDSAMSRLVERLHKPAPDPRDVKPDVPAYFARIILRCLEKDPAQRYQTVEEILRDLDAQQASAAARPLARRAWLSWKVAATALALVALIVFGYVRARRAAPVPARSHEPVSLLIADFANRAGDPVFEGSLEQALSIAVEGASFITSYSRTAAQKLAVQIRPGSRLDESAARLISVREGIKVVLAGSIETSGSGYRIAVKAIDPAIGKDIATATASASTKADVLQAVGSLAAKIRGALGDTTPESGRLAAAETFTAGSLDAVRNYSLAQDLASSGKDEEAVGYYKRAIEQDPNFGRAYSGWATSAFKLGRTDEAAELWKKALALMDRMTDREKYRTLGAYYLAIARNYDKAIENYTTLVKLYPADRGGHGNLALAYFYILNFQKALEEGRRAIEIYPKDVTFRNNYALYAMYAGDFATAATEAGQVIEQTPAFYKAYLPLAVAALAGSNAGGARDAYARMARAGARGASLASTGLADLALYEGRNADAEAGLKAGIAQDEETRNTAGLAAKYVALAEAYEGEGKAPLATQAVESALKLARGDAVLVPAARIFLRAGRDADAKAIAGELDNQLQTQIRAYAKILEGELALRRRRTADAVEAFRAAQKLADVWLGRFDLGVTYVEAGHYAEGLSELETCQKRRGEATALFLDDVPTFRYLAPIPYWLARAQQELGLKSAAAANYKAYLALRPDAAADPLAADAKRRLEAL